MAQKKSEKKSPESKALAMKPGAKDLTVAKPPGKLVITDKSSETALPNNMKKSTEEMPPKKTGEAKEFVTQKSAEKGSKAAPKKKNTETKSKTDKSAPSQSKAVTVKTTTAKTGRAKRKAKAAKKDDLFICSAISPKHHLESFLDGTNARAWEYFGSHTEGEKTIFRVWAPNARMVSLAGDFTDWEDRPVPMKKIGGGVWEVTVPKLEVYSTYKYLITTVDGKNVFKADPYAFHAETRPGNASKIYDISGYKWSDKRWITHRRRHKVYESPMNTYELHMGSWRKHADGNFLSYRDLADQLVPYLNEMNYTHVELMPITEYPLDDSWGYQCTGYYAPTSRYGTPDDFKYFVEACHKGGIGVILDWVPAHFPKDAFGLYKFDGTCCYEYSDPQKAEHYNWGTLVFDYGRKEVVSFLISSACFWIEEYHIDGIRVDAVASMLYLDYDRKDGEWTPNNKGGKENWEAIKFLKDLNTAVFSIDDSLLMIAEESTAWPLVTKPDGLGFNLKWNMGWMNDVLHYVELDPYFRQFNHKDITFSFHYAFSENYVLPLSHDEVVHMKNSLINKMPGETDEKMAHVRVFYSYMLAHPGKKLLFMGSEFGQFSEWNYTKSIEWFLLDCPEHQKLHEFFKAANAFYKSTKELWEIDFSWEGFEWIYPDDNHGNCVSFFRKNKHGEELIFICNFSGISRNNYSLGVNKPGTYIELFNSDREEYGGKGGLNKPMEAREAVCYSRPYTIDVDVPPLGAVFIKRKK